VFASSRFARQIAEIELGLKEPVIRVGNLSAKRDFSDIRDIVKAYELAVQFGEPGEVYNLGSGFSYSIRDILGILLDLSGLDITIQEDPERLRPSDVPELRCDFSKFNRVTGWVPEIPIQRTLEDLLNEWRGKLRKNTTGHVKAAKGTIHVKPYGRMQA
jgi:GDP-4-dehydro-6-deoxy-D-mannose reductase